MEIASQNPDHGFQFPGIFELSALGRADADLERVLPELLTAAGIRVEAGLLQSRPSSGRRYVSVRIAFHAEDRAQYDLAHQMLRDHPEVKWTL